MKKRLVVIKQGNPSGVEDLEQVLNSNGWNCETIVLSKGEPLPKSLEHIEGLLIIADPLSVYECAMNPMQIYVGA